MEEYGNDYIVLTDDDGNEVEVEHLDTIARDGATYMAFTQATQVLDDPGDLFILKVETDEEKNEDYFVTIEDEELLQALYDVFVERLEDMYEFVDEE